MTRRLAWRACGRWALGGCVAASAWAVAARGQQPAAPSPTPEERLRADRAALDKIRGERAELEQRLAELRSTVHDLADEVANLDRQADATARAVAELNRQLIATTTEVNTATGDLVHAQDELAMKQAVLRHRLVDIYKRGPLYTTEALLTAESFGALVARYKYLHLLALRDQALVGRVQLLRDHVDHDRTVLVGLQRAIEENRSEKTSEERRLRGLEDTRRERLRDVRQTQAVTARRLKQIADAETRLSSVITSIEEARRRAESRANAPAPAASTLNTRDLGRLDWPVEGPILYRFGRVVNPNTNTTTRWNGIGIGASLGAVVRAVAAGQVVVARTIGTYGPTVIVQHGGGDYSVYGSLSRMDVKPGDHVNRGDVVGAVGRTDPDLPAHLHFEIRRDQGRSVDPLEWLRGGSTR